MNLNTQTISKYNTIGISILFSHAHLIKKIPLKILPGVYEVFQALCQ